MADWMWQVIEHPWPGRDDQGGRHTPHEPDGDGQDPAADRHPDEIGTEKQDEVPHDAGDQAEGKRVRHHETDGDRPGHARCFAAGHRAGADLLHNRSEAVVIRGPSTVHNQRCESSQDSHQRGPDERAQWASGFAAIRRGRQT